jgi:hypothetical protein
MAKPYSISQLEIKTAHELHKQVYVFVEKAVLVEYRTWLRNESNQEFQGPVGLAEEAPDVPREEENPGFAEEEPPAGSTLSALHFLGGIQLAVSAST